VLDAGAPFPHPEILLLIIATVPVLSCRETLK
jgi:hypothetical protein